MSSLKDILDFEEFNLKSIWEKIKQDPERLLIGALGPWGTEAWGKVLGKDYGKMVNALGAPVESTFEAAEAAGIDTDAGRAMHDIAQLIAGSMVGAYGVSALPIPEIPGIGGAGTAGAGGAGAGSGAGGGGGFSWASLANLIPKQPPPEEEKKRRMLELLPIQPIQQAPDLQTMMKNFAETGTLYG